MGIGSLFNSVAEYKKVFEDKPEADGGHHKKVVVDSMLNEHSGNTAETQALDLIGRM
jgi:hypothetical protein